MILTEDCQRQLDSILKLINTDQVINYNFPDIKKGFSYLYVINYLSKRVELKRFFNTTYYHVSYSCLIEAFHLILENYPRGSALVLRSGLENFLKHTIEISGEGNYKINDRSYTANMNTLEKIINKEVQEKYRKLFRRTNAQMFTVYRELSGLSHSLTVESKSNILRYFTDVKMINKQNIDFVIEKLVVTLEYLLICSLLISRSSLEKWVRDNLNEILRVAFGQKRTEKFLQLFSLYTQ
ncbi:hypothetical protein NSQ61_17970 [Aeribacillus sp. FSL K6-1121]|uniref:hypothetical protein n=1 Tax=Aeribacillus sp. FSL K6-1121 TaxID=2954745 RepID=UPI0030FBC4D3